MNWSLYLGKYAGIKVFLHWTFSLLLLWIAISGITQGQTTIQILWTMGFILAVFMCVLLHEFGHALMARRYHFKTKYITLLPIGGLAQMEKLPDDPKQELWVAIAGPLVNIVIAGILLLFLPSLVDFDPETLTAIGPDNFFVFLFSVNLILALFNLLPAFPMDGGRVLRAILSFKLPREQATRIAAGIGQFMAIVFVFAGLFYNPFLVLIGIFIFLGAQAENTMVQSQSQLKGFVVKDVLMQDFPILSPNDTLKRPSNLLLDSQATDFVVVQDEALVGLLSRSELIRGLSEWGTEGKVADVMIKEFPRLSLNQALEEVYLEMRSTGHNILPVMDGNKLLGILDTENISEFILIKEAMAAGIKRVSI
jgi:Zn-dependent protease/CBS domain-containing protein